MPEVPEYPKMLSDPTGTQVPDRLVNDATEESAARLAGFTVVVPIPTTPAVVPATADPAFPDAPDISGLLQQLRDLHPTGKFSDDEAAKAEAKDNAKKRDDVLGQLNQKVVELEEKATASTDPTTIAVARKHADILRGQINIAHYVK